MKRVLFFDGVCGLCNRVVDYLIRQDKERYLKFAPLQGRSAHQFLPPEFLNQPDYATVVLWDEGKIFLRSEAALRALIYCGGIWTVLGRLGLFVPRFLRDGVYNLVARNRYQIFGKRDSCRIPTAQERSYFLD